MEGLEETCVHAVMIPLPGQGHINPMIILAKRLAEKGITISFVLTKSWRDIIQDAHSNDKDAFTHARDVLGLPINAVCLPNFLPDEFERWKNKDVFYQSLVKMETLVENLISHLNSSDKSPPVSCIIADVFLYWAVPLAHKLGLMSMTLWTQSVFVLCVSYHSKQVESQMEAENSVPGLDFPLLESDLPLSLKQNNNVTIISQAMEMLKETDFCVCNSFRVLESQALEILRKEVNLSFVGPLLPSVYFDKDSKDEIFGTSSRTEIDCTQWLDSKPAKSVLYISFGSLIPVPAAQMRELAFGIKDSGCNFLWVLKELRDHNVSEVLPIDFAESIGDKGMVVPWCSQMKILSHPSIAGFLSHCGWNSTMESICCGVPLLGFPLGAEQPANCKMIADVWKIGLRLKNLDDFVYKEEVAEKIKTMYGDMNIRKNIGRLSHISKSHAIKGGESHQNLDIIVNSMKGRILQKLIASLETKGSDS